MKAEIEKILEELVDNSVGCVCIEHKEGECICAKEKALATSSLTSLIIKWLEGKKGGRRICFGEDCTKDRVKYRNQLITELVEELK